MPNSIATSLTVHFQCQPGSKILTNILLAIATDVIIGNINATNGIQSILESVISKGDRDFWSTAPRHSCISAGIINKKK